MAKEEIQPEQSQPVFVESYSVLNGIVFKNGVTTVCPFAPRSFKQSAIAGGPPEIMSYPCNLQCPKCNLAMSKDAQGNEQHFIEISCGGAVQFPPIQIAQPEHAKVKKIFKD
jgi:hypothetical protein